MTDIDKQGYTVRPERCGQGSDVERLASQIADLTDVDDARSCIAGRDEAIEFNLPTSRFNETGFDLEPSEAGKGISA